MCSLYSATATGAYDRQLHGACNVQAGEPSSLSSHACAGVPYGLLAVVPCVRGSPHRCACTRVLAQTLCLTHVIVRPFQMLPTAFSDWRQTCFVLAGIPAQMEGLVATVLLKLPFFKHVFAWMGCLPAGKAHLMA